MGLEEINSFKKSIYDSNTFCVQKEKIFNSFINTGFPNKKYEGWKYFDLRFKSKSFLEKEISDCFINIEDLSVQNTAHDSYDCNLLFDDYFKPYEFIENEAVIDFNIACGNQIKIINVTSSQKEPINIKISNTGINVFLPRIIINLSDNVKAKINFINSFKDGFLNLLIEYNIGKNSELDICRVNKSSSLMVETNLVYLKSKSSFNMNNLSIPNSSSRFQLFTNHIGENSFCSSKTISIPSNESNDDILIDNIFKHSNCESISGIRAILREDAICSFQSMIDVKNSVKGSKAEQDCKGFLIDDKATMNAKPQMRILNDDVVCKHGATVGSLNEEEIFYLCSKGIERKQAINLILDGHINSYIGEDRFLKQFLPEEFR